MNNTKEKTRLIMLKALKEYEERHYESESEEWQKIVNTAIEHLQSKEVA